MKAHTVALVVAAAAALTVGCAAEEDIEMREAAYPAPIGYTPPAQRVASPARTNHPLAAQATAQATMPEDAAPSDEVVVGAGDEGDGYSDTDPAALADFRSTLEPYGSWTEDATYGTVWVPSPSVVGQDFTPYVTAGHWVYDGDYAWVSDYDWGWAPFHYGRWAYVGSVGWGWIPGRVYGGAWVSWRYGWDDWGYVGWAPLPPTWCWHHGVAVGIGFVPVAPYSFVATGGLFGPAIATRVVAGAQVGVIGAHTRPWVPASPGVGGRFVASPGVGGPPPSMLHLPSSAVAHAAFTDRGLVQARAFSRPSSAVALGAHPAQTAMARAPSAWSSASPTFAPGTAAVRATGFDHTPARAQEVPSPSSHFGGRLLGGGFAGSAAAAPMRSPSYTSSPRPYFGSPHDSSPRPAYSAAPTFRAPSQVPSVPSGAYHVAAPMAPSTGSYHMAAPSGGYHVAAPSGGGYHTGAGFGGGGGFRGGAGSTGGAGFHGGGAHGGGRR
jgi:hypothetical protein